MKRNRLLVAIWGLSMAMGMTGMNGMVAEAAGTPDPIAKVPTAPPSMMNQVVPGVPSAFPVEFSPDNTPGQSSWTPVEYDTSGNRVDWMSAYGNNLNSVWQTYISSRQNVKNYPYFEDYYKAQTGRDVEVWQSQTLSDGSTREVVFQSNIDRYRVEEPTYKQHQYERPLGYHQEVGEGTWMYDTIPIEKWELAHYPAQCIHAAIEDKYGYAGYPNDAYRAGDNICGRPYYSGWRAYCAYCGEPVHSGAGYLMYMTEATASKIDVIDAGRLNDPPKMVYRSTEDGTPKYENTIQYAILKKRMGKSTKSINGTINQSMGDHKSIIGV